MYIFSAKISLIDVLLTFDLSVVEIFQILGLNKVMHITLCS